MNRRSRREFLEDVGRGMLVASLGSAAAFDLGMVPCVADELGKRLTFGELEPLVSLMQETPPDKLLPLLVEQIEVGHRTQNARHRGGAGQCPRVWRPGLHRLSHVHGLGAGLPDGERAAHRASAAAGAQGVVPQQQPHPGAARRRSRCVAPSSSGDRVGGFGSGRRNIARLGACRRLERRRSAFRRASPKAPSARPSITCSLPCRMR